MKHFFSVRQQCWLDVVCYCLIHFLLSLHSNCYFAVNLWWCFYFIKIYIRIHVFLKKIKVLGSNIIINTFTSGKVFFSCKFKIHEYFFILFLNENFKVFSCNLKLLFHLSMEKVFFSSPRHFSWWMIKNINIWTINFF